MRKDKSEIKPRLLDRILFFLGKIVLLLVIPVGCCFLYSWLFVLNKWQKLPVLPVGMVADVLDVDMQPMGHIDQLYSMNQSGKLFLWQRDPTILKLIFPSILSWNSGGLWTPVTMPQETPIIEIVSDNSFPVMGVYGKDIKGQTYVYDLEANKWQLTDLSALPPPKSDYCNPWPKLPIPENKVAEKFALCFEGAFSEEWRYYVRDTNGSIWLWSKTHSLFTVTVGFTGGLIIGALVDISLIIYWSRQRLVRFFSHLKKIGQKAI